MLQRDLLDNYIIESYKYQEMTCHDNNIPKNQTDKELIFSSVYS